MNITGECKTFKKHAISTFQNKFSCQMYENFLLILLGSLTGAVLLINKHKKWTKNSVNKLDSLISQDL